MRSYDDWKLDCPDDMDVYEIASYYDVHPDEVTADMLADYELDMAEDAATRFDEEW